MWNTGEFKEKFTQKWDSSSESSEENELFLYLVEFDS